MLTLEEIIKRYKNEEYEFFKYNNSDGESIRKVFIFESHSDYLDKYLDYYKQLPNLTEVIVYSTEGTFKVTNNGIEYFIRHSHQDVFTDKEGNTRGVPKETSKLVRNNLIKRIDEIMSSSSFDELMGIVTDCKVRGFGELSIYDTSLRIGKFLNLEPDKVYLIAGAKVGFEALERKGYLKKGVTNKKYLTKEELPEEIGKQLKPHQAHNFGCSYKKELEDLEPFTTKVSSFDLPF